jgi:hypothetical protein
MILDARPNLYGGRRTDPSSKLYWLNIELSINDILFQQRVESLAIATRCWRCEALYPYRLRRLKAGLLRVACGDGVRSVAGKLGPIAAEPWSLYDLAAKWMSGDTEARKRFDEILKKVGLGMEDVMAEALLARSTPSNALTAWLPAPKRVATTPCVRLIVTAQHSAPQCGK